MRFGGFFEFGFKFFDNFGEVGVVEDDFVVEEVIKNHGDGGGKNKNTSGFDKIIVEREAHGGGNVIGKLVERRDEAEKSGKDGGNNDAGDAVPEEEHGDAVTRDAPFLPSDFGVHDESQNGGEDVGNDGIEPKEFVGIHDDASEGGINEKIEERKKATYDCEFADTKLHIVIITPLDKIVKMVYNIYVYGRWFY